MKTPHDLGFSANPFPQHGVPPSVHVPFAAYPLSELNENALEKWLKNIYSEKRPSCYIFTGDFGSGKSHLKNSIYDLASKNGYHIKEEGFDTPTSLCSTILSTQFAQKRTIILFDEVQGLMDKVRKNPDAISNFKVELRSFLEGYRGADREEAFSNVTILLFCTPQVRSVILFEEDMSQRFMLTVKPLPPLEPYIGLNVCKNFLRAYAEASASAKLRTNPYYPFDRYTILSLINLCPYVVEKKGASYRPTTRFLIELLRHCFDYTLQSDLDSFGYGDLPSALKETKVLEMTFDLAPNTQKIMELAKSPEGKTVARFLGTSLGWWTIHDIHRACKISIDQAKRVLHEELSPIINAEQCWILGYESVEKNVKSEIKKLGKRYEERIDDVFSIPWVTPDDEPCYLVIPSLHLIDNQIERIFKRFAARQEDIYWLTNTFEVFHVTLEREFKKFSSEQTDALRRFLEADSLEREQKLFGQLKLVATHASLRTQNIMEHTHTFGDEVRRVLGLKVAPHASAQQIFYRVGIRFLSVPPSGIIDAEFRELIEWLKTSVCDFIILFTYPELVEYKRLESYMREEVKWAPANKRIFIKNLSESDLATILTDPAGFSPTLEELILGSIRDFNEGMLVEHLLMPLRGLKQAHKRLNPNDGANIYGKLGEKWFRQVYEAIEDDTTRDFIKENYRGPSEGAVEFADGEIIHELLDQEYNVKISDYEQKVYNLLEDYYRIEKETLENELDRSFVSGALYKLEQAGVNCYQFIVEVLLSTKNLVKIAPEFDPSGRQKIVIATRRISEDKHYISNLVKDIEQVLIREIKINFDGELWSFSNKKYIGGTLDKLKLIDDYTQELLEPTDLLDKALVLSQLSFLSRSIEKLRTQPVDDFSGVTQRIQECIDTYQRAEGKLENELAKRSTTIKPKSFVTVKSQVKKTLSKVSKQISNGRLLKLIVKDVEKLEELMKSFENDCDQLVQMMQTIEDEITENNEKYENITNKKKISAQTFKQISHYKIDKYFESTLVPAEKSAFEGLSTFLGNVNSLDDSDEINPEEMASLLKELEKSEFNEVLKRYQKNIKSVRELTLQIDGQYIGFSSEFISKSETLVSSLATFWSQRMSGVEDKVYALKTATDGVARAQKLVDLYYEIIKVVSVPGANIAHAIACGFLESFLFADKARAYAEKLGMSPTKFSEGLNSLKKAGVLKEGVG